MAVIAAGALGAAIGGIAGLVRGAVIGGRLIYDVQQIGLLSSNARFLAEARHCHLVEPKQNECVVLGLKKWGKGRRCWWLHCIVVVCVFILVRAMHLRMCEQFLMEYGQLSIGMVVWDFCDWGINSV